MLRAVAHIWFNTLLVACLLFVNAIVVPASYILPKTYLGALTRFLFTLGAKAMLALSPHISLQQDGDELWKGIGSSGGRPQLLIINHTSFFDFFTSVVLGPTSFISTSRILVSTGVCNIPLFGRLVLAGEGIPVYFKVHESGSKWVDHDAGYSVDKDKIKHTNALIDAHLSTNGALVLFPEGRINTIANATTLQDFRFGAFDAAHRFDAEIWGLCLRGCEHVWPSDATLGGAPATVRARLFPIAPKGAAAMLADEQKQLDSPSQTLARACQREFQAVLDKKVAADGK